MILDSSVLVAIVLEDIGFDLLVEKMDTAKALAIGAPTLFETRIVLAKKPVDLARQRLDDFLERIDARIVPFTSEHVTAAIEAYDRYGKGRHPAQLNFGDCMSYAIARISRQPLLFIGDDFSKTDIEAA
jgi:ribonuclease VapC